MVVKIKWSKTLQLRERTLEIPVFSIPNSILCPVKAVKRLMKISKAKKGGPLLTISDSKIFTYSMLQRKLKLCVKQLGLKQSRYSSHSMRRGAVIWAELNAVPESLIKIYGDWSSNAYHRYLQFPEEVRVSVGHKMARRYSNYKNLF